MRIFKLVLIALTLLSSINLKALSIEVPANLHNVAVIASNMHDVQINSNSSNEHVVLSPQRSNIQINITRRTNNDAQNSNANILYIPNNAKLNLIKHLYLQSYFDKEPELALLPFLYQIQPNAP